MEINLPNVRHISYAAKSAAKFIDDLRHGRIKSLRTSKSKLNSLLLNGVDWWRILTVAGLPGGGKSTFISEMRRDFIALNKDQKFEILSFEFEMRMEDQMARDLSSVTGKSVKQLYSSESAVTDDEFKIIEEELYKMSDAPLFYVEKMISPTDVVETIRTFAAQRMIGEGKGLVVTIDHILLTKGRSSDLEKAKIDELCHLLVGLKKEFSYAGIPIMIILLSQLNREIQSQERVMNPKSHYPTQSDLFAASSVYQASDYVIVIHRPAIVSGMGMYYGPPIEGHPNGLPVMCPTIPSKTMVYLHLIKERFGQTRVIPCVENFQVGKITEYDL